MIAPPTAQCCVRCPRCDRPIYVRVHDPAPVWRALRLHLDSPAGCAGRRRR